jgi:hypothetical protein
VLIRDPLEKRLFAAIFYTFFVDAAAQSDHDLKKFSCDEEFFRAIRGARDSIALDGRGAVCTSECLD